MCYNAFWQQGIVEQSLTSYQIADPSNGNLGRADKSPKQSKYKKILEETLFNLIFISEEQDKEHTETLLWRDYFYKPFQVAIHEDNP